MRLAYCAALVGLLGLGGLVGCGSGAQSGGPRACTEIGCEDQLTLTLADASGGLPSGMQTLTVTADGAATTCSFTLPLASGGSVTCPSGLQVVIMQKQTCTTMTGAYATSQTCTPVAGKFSELLTLTSTPAAVHVTQTSDGATLLDTMVSPTYRMSQPNGPGCDPICSQGSGSLVLGAM